MANKKQMSGRDTLFLVALTIFARAVQITREFAEGGRYGAK
jgi:hypothetical protein